MIIESWELYTLIKAYQQITMVNNCNSWWLFATIIFYYDSHYLVELLEWNDDPSDQQDSGF